MSSINGIIRIRNPNKKHSNMSASPKKYPQKSFKAKLCKVCDQIFNPRGPSHHYCSQNCADWANTDNYYKNSYGVGLDVVEKLYHKQGGLCAICKQVGFKMLENHRTSLSLDHCHATGKIRGLLCHSCNQGLGLFKDDPQNLEAAAVYLREDK